MKLRFFGVLVVAASVASVTLLSAAGGPDTPREAYARALAQERLVRDAAAHPTLPQMRRVIALYEGLVRRHPTSGYSDNALWQAGNLAALAYQRFGDETDRKTATRLLTLLTTQYPSSTLVARVPAALTDLSDSVPTAPAASAPAAPPAPVSDLDPKSTPSGATVPPPAAKGPPISAGATTASPGSQKSRSDPGAAGVTVLREVKRTVLPDGVRLTVELEGEIAYHQEEIANPRRLFFDLKNVKTVPALQDASLKFDDNLVREIRLGRHPQNTTRLVVDLDGVGEYTVYPLYGPYRLVIDLQRATGTAEAGPAATTGMAASKTVRNAAGPPTPAPTRALAAVFTAPPVPPLPKGEPLAMPVSTVAKATLPAPPPAVERPEVKGPAPMDRADARPAVSDRSEPKSNEPRPLPSKPARASLTPAAPAANSNGSFSLSRQLGLSVGRVVIDAGHGGHDPGAHGNGINEAELTLDVALRLRALLEKADIDVVMTRDTDVFIPLEERTAIANRESADLFLSIHANASRNPQAHGIETYYLNFATNPEAESVAARENAASGQPMHSLPDIVKAIALHDKSNESREFADSVQKSMARQLAAKNKTLRDLGVKQAPFVVLIGAVMPSVLAEISFVTNRQDAAMLKTAAYKQQIAQALMDAIQNYQQSLKRMNGAAGKKATNQ
ncbi:MAG TPA: N-acetylmuramoyl-L-alanine amidase [Vicinamibacterales bacterium]|jgi:N-acetylmuramoyl-L-alanine amidase